MNNLLMTYEGMNDVRTMMVDDEVWFALIDVCKILELTNPRRVAQRLDDDELRNFKLRSQAGDTWFVNEAGLYHVILTSRSDKAKPFRRWVTHEVLPAIRKQGFYSMLTKEKLVEVLTEKQREDSTYLDCIDKQGIKRALKNEEREARLLETRKLWCSIQTMDYYEFRKELKRIWAGDSPMMHKYLDRHEVDCRKIERGEFVVSP